MKKLLLTAVPLVLVTAFVIRPKNTPHASLEPTSFTAAAVSDPTPPVAEAAPAEAALRLTPEPSAAPAPSQPAPQRQAPAAPPVAPVLRVVR